MVTKKSSNSTIAPVTPGPDAGVTVRVTVLRADSAAGGPPRPPVRHARRPGT